MATSLEREVSTRSTPHPNPLPQGERGSEAPCVCLGSLLSVHPESCPERSRRGVEGRLPAMDAVEDVLLEAFVRVFGLTLVEEREAVGAR